MVDSTTAFDQSMAAGWRAAASLLVVRDWSCATKAVCRNNPATLRPIVNRRACRWRTMLHPWARSQEILYCENSDSIFELCAVLLYTERKDFSENIRPPVASPRFRSVP